MGIPFSIDDFDGGYSSLVRAQATTIDEIKIDKSFVMNMTSDSNDQAIVRSIIDLAHGLGKRVWPRALKLRRRGSRC
jgi:EAL domain-containing protein (putative c-di-GMP-specific phosphodiesterase class I)